MSKIGILGGTFDPIHNGHIVLAKTALEELKLDEIILIPAYIPPHKQNMDVSSDKKRLAMVELAVNGMNDFYVSDMEIKMQGASYTARTLTAFKEKNPTDELYFIVGADSYMALENWYHPDVIFSKAVIVCACRDDVDTSILRVKADYYHDKYNAKTDILSMKNIDISSTHIRECIKSGASVDSLIAPQVYKYIIKEGLYR